MLRTIRKLVFRTEVALFFATSLLTIVVTWPLILNPLNSTYGFPGDNFGHIYYLWWWRKVYFENLNLYFLPFQEAPFGLTVPKDPGTVVFLWPSYILSLFFNEVLVYNFLLMIAFPLASLSSYLFFREVGAGKLSAIIFSIVFSFSPYHLWKSYNHLDLAMIQYIPLFLWSLIRFEKVKNFYRALICGLMLSLLILLNFYYGFFALLTTFFFFLFGLLKDLAWRREKIIRRLFFYTLIPLTALLISLPFIYPVFKTFVFKTPVTVSSAEAYDRPLDNLLLLTARPWSYFLPSVDNPFLGGLSLKAYEFIKGLSNDFKTAIPFAHETTVYLGFFSITFFIVTIILWWKKRVSSLPLPILILSSFFLIITSFPPFVIIKGITIYLPSFYLHRYFPMFRSYGRLGIFVLPLVAAVSSLGFDYFLKKLSFRKKVLMATVSLLLIIFEFANVPPPKVTSFSKIPAVYEWLKGVEGDPIVLEYPKNFNLTDGEIFQRYHLKRTANWHSNSPYFRLWDYVENIYDPVSFEILSGLGVEYIIFHEKLLFPDPNPVDELWPQRAFTVPIVRDKLPENIEKVGTFDGAEVYRLSPQSLSKVVIILKDTNNQLKVEVVGGSTWAVANKSNLFIINLTRQSFAGELGDGKGKIKLEIAPGKTVILYARGDYRINFDLAMNT